MKVFITQDKNNKDIFVEIHCSAIDSDIEKLNTYISNYDKRIKANDESETLYVELSDILYFESVDNKTFIYTADRILTTSMKLYEIEEKLGEKDFFRCSKSVIVNIGKIKRLKPDLTRNIFATLVNEETIVISRRYVSAFKKLIKEE